MYRVRRADYLYNRGYAIINNIFLPTKYHNPRRRAFRVIRQSENVKENNVLSISFFPRFF